MCCQVLSTLQTAMITDMSGREQAGGQVYVRRRMVLTNLLTCELAVESLIDIGHVHIPASDFDRASVRAYMKSDPGRHPILHLTGLRATSCVACWRSHGVFRSVVLVLE